MLSTSQAETIASVGQAREQGDLLADLRRERALRAAHQHVRGDPDAPQLVDRVLGRLGLQLARVADVGDERQVDEHAAPAPHVNGELADRLEERQRLDVADRAADLGDRRSPRREDSAISATRCLISSVMCGTTWTVPPR